MPSQECKSRKLAQVETNWTDRSPPPDIISNQTTRRSNRERKQTNGIEWTIRKQKRSSERETGTHCSTGSPWRRRAEGWGVGRRIRRRRRRRAGGKLRTPSFEFERARGLGKKGSPFPGLYIRLKFTELQFYPRSPEYLLGISRIYEKDKIKLFWFSTAWSIFDRL